MRRVLLVLVFLLVSTLAIPSSSAQVPGVELECESGNLEIDVSPSGSRMTTVSCTATNTGALPEEVDLAVSAGSLSSAAPGKITIPPSDSVEFDVSFQANQGQSPAEHEFNVSATVTSIGSFPASQFGLTDEFGGTITILPYAELIVDLNSMTRSIDSGDSFEVLVEASNNGNGYLNAHFGFSQETADELISAGFTFVSTGNSSIAWGVSTGLYSDIEGKSFNYVLLAPSFEEDQEFEVEYCGTIESVGVDAMSAEDVTNSEPICDSFKVKVAAEPKDALGTVGSAIGIDDQTTMMMIIGGGGGVGLLLVMMVVLKVGKAKKKRTASLQTSDDFDDDLDDFDDDFIELDDEELDFGDL